MSSAPPIPEDALVLHRLDDHTQVPLLAEHERIQEVGEAQLAFRARAGSPNPLPALVHAKSENRGAEACSVVNRPTVFLIPVGLVKYNPELRQRRGG